MAKVALATTVPQNLIEFQPMKSSMNVGILAATKSLMKELFYAVLFEYQLNEDFRRSCNIILNVDAPWIPHFYDRKIDDFDEGILREIFSDIQDDITFITYAPNYDQSTRQRVVRFYQLLRDTYHDVCSEFELLVPKGEERDFSRPFLDVPESGEDMFDLSVRLVSSLHDNGLQQPEEYVHGNSSYLLSTRSPIPYALLRLEILHLLRMEFDGLLGTFFEHRLSKLNRVYVERYEMDLSYIVDMRKEIGFSATYDLTFEHDEEFYPIEELKQFESAILCFVSISPRRSSATSWLNVRSGRR